MSNITVKWHAEDGYVRPGPQSFRLNVEEMAESCETEQEARDYLSDALQDEFLQRVTPVMANEDDVIAAWQAAKREGKQA